MTSLFIISAGYGYGGAERQIERMLQPLERDFKLTIFAESPTHIAALERCMGRSSRLVRLCPSPKRYSFDRQILSLTLRILFNRPDAILANNYHSAMLLAAAASYLPRMRSRIFLFVHDYVWRKLHVPFKYLPSAHVLLPTPALLEVPNYIAEYLIPRGPHRYSVVPNAVSLSAADRSDASGDGYVLHLATRNPFKGHIHLIRAAALLRDSGRATQIVSVGPAGPDDLEESLRREIADAALTPWFFLGDYVDDPADLIAKCSCLVVTSVSHSGGPEAFGGSIIEAWAYRKPVVVFAAGGPGRMVEHQHDGLLVAEGDEHGLAEALWRLRQEPALARRLGENGYAKVRQSFTVERVGQRLKDIIAGDDATEDEQTGSFAATDGKPVPSSKGPDPSSAAPPAEPLARGPVRRNALCPCGSGKRYKHCHGRD
jgi:glycosyltransferase involved in cell wall biosynthesis